MQNEIKASQLSWLEGHFLGNGDLGAVVWGNSDAIRVGLSKHDVNDHRTGGMNDGARWAQSYPEMLDKIRNGERDFLDHLSNVENISTHPSMLAAGCLVFEVGRGIPTAGYEQSLDDERARVTSALLPTEAGRTWNQDFCPITLTSIIPAEHNALQVTLSSRLEQRILWNFSINPVQDLPPPEYILHDTETALMCRSLPMNAHYTIAVHTPGLIYVSPLGMQGELSFGGDLGDVELLLTMSSNYEGEEDKERALQTLASLRHSTPSAITAAHEAWWESFWSKSSISYEDKEIEKVWRLGLYTLGASTRPHTSPPNLQGIWNQYNHPPWSADFHLNTNVQECQWLACVSNHPELQEALVQKLTVDWLAPLESFTRENYKSDGIAVPLCVDWLGRPIGFLQLDLALSMSAWMAGHLWQQWEYTHDAKMLKEKIYPFLKRSAHFYMDVLHKGEDGLYHTELTQSPEQLRVNQEGKNGISYGRDALIDIAFIKTLMASVIEAAVVINEQDEEWVNACMDILKHLPNYPKKDGVWIDYETGYFHSGDAPGQFKLSHRHPSRLVPIFPCAEFGLHSSPEDFALAEASYREFRSYGSEGFSGWSIAWQSILAARLGLGEEFEDRIGEFSSHYLLPNGISSHNLVTTDSVIFQLEALLGAAAGINEALVHNSGDILYVFRGIPRNRSASFQGLRPSGGFCVSAAKTKDHISFVEVESLFGGPLQIANPWPSQAVIIKGPEGVETQQGKILTINTSTGKFYRLEKG